MFRNVQKLILIFTLLLFAARIESQENSGIGQRYALLIAGPGGQQEFTTKYLAQTTRLLSVLLDSLQYKKENIVYLHEHVSLDSTNIDGVATADNVRRALLDFKERLGPKDQLFVFMTGHGSFDGEWSKFNLVGPDLRDIDYAQLLAQLPTKKIIVVNTSSASGPFIRRLSAEERVIVTATKSGAQQFETNFADFFLDAITSGAADFDKDARISIAEAFNHARGSQDRWFEDKRLLRAEHPLLDDNADGDGSQDLGDSKDGSWASRVFLGPPSPEIRSTLEGLTAGSDSERDKLVLRKAALDEEIADLKARKEQLSPKAYSQKLETLLIELARISKQLKEDLPEG